MSANFAMSPQIEAPEDNAAEERIIVPDAKPRLARGLLVSAQVLVLLAYAMGLAFLIKTTVGTMVLFSLLAPILVAIAVVTLTGVGIHEIRRHATAGFQIYDSGQIIFRQGELGDCAYFIQSGEVEVIRFENGSEKLIAKLSEGEYFGEKALIQSAPRSTTTRAATQTRVAVIRKRNFFTMIIVTSGSVPDETGDHRRKRIGKRNHN